MITVEFTKDFSGRKKGETFKCDNFLASDLMNEGVAKIYQENTKKSK